MLTFKEFLSEDEWKTINGSPVLIDANGNIVGGAGGKFTGNKFDKNKKNK